MHGSVTKSNVNIRLVVYVILLINYKHKIFKVFDFIPIIKYDKL
jgi:hypothetical protein